MNPSNRNEPEKDLAKLSGFDVWLEDHGIIVMAGRFDYEEGSSQGLGYCIDINFIKQFMQVFNIDYLQQVNGRSCWVTHTFDKIIKLEPLHKKDGKTFDIEKWSKELQAKSK